MSGSTMRHDSGGTRAIVPTIRLAFADRDCKEALSNTFIYSVLYTHAHTLVFTPLNFHFTAAFDFFSYTCLTQCRV